MNGMQNKQLSGSKKVRSIGVHASENENSDSENDDYPLIASKMKELKTPAKSLYHNELNLEDERVASEEDYHSSQTSRPTIGKLHRKELKIRKFL